MDSAGMAEMGHDMGLPPFGRAGPGPERMRTIMEPCVVGSVSDIAAPTFPLSKSHATLAAVNRPAQIARRPLIVSRASFNQSDKVSGRWYGQALAA